MTIREQLEQRERTWFSPFAMLSENGEIREKPISPDDVRTSFQRDRDRIIHCKSFRRLKHKTQCFLVPEGDHIRTRLTHTLEVSQIARTLARSLRLNEDLAEAIALGHDLGHTPFGHMGERILDRLMQDGFEHREHSLRIVEVLEKQGEGLNLTAAVRDGIAHHSGPVPPKTLEGQCVSRADRIAYINHDLDDAFRAGILTEEDIPKALTDTLGETQGERINRMVRNIIETSQDGEGVRMSPDFADATGTLRTFLFERVYLREEVTREEEKADRMIESLFAYILEHPQTMPEDYLLRGYQVGLEKTVGDFIAGMTDRYAVRLFQDVFIPSTFVSE